MTSHLRPVPPARMRTLSMVDITRAAGLLATKLQAMRSMLGSTRIGYSLYGVPRGGISAALALSLMDRMYSFADTPEAAHLIVDDLIDSGATLRRYSKYGKPFVSLFSKHGAFVHSDVDIAHGEDADPNTWLIFPWEGTEGRSAEDICTRLLQFIGEDPQREGLKETPDRFYKAWKLWSEGYRADPKEVLKSFEDGANEYDQMLVQRDIPVYSHCEHHLAPFFGVAHVAYIPQGKIVGLSKLSRLVDVFSRRLQVQERLTVQIAGALEEGLKAKGVAVMLQCRHLCMESRGVQRAGLVTVTTSLRGVMRAEAARAEFLSAINAKGAV